jgi:hypothetical protein
MVFLSARASLSRLLMACPASRSATSNCHLMILPEETTSRRTLSYRYLLVRVVVHNGVYTGSRNVTELGIDLGTVGFQASFDGTVIGRAFALFFQQRTPINMYYSPVCDIISSCTRVGDKGTYLVASHPNREASSIATESSSLDFLAGQNQTLNIQGDSALLSGTTTVGWLSSVFKTLTSSHPSGAHISSVFYFMSRVFRHY